MRGHLFPPSGPRQMEIDAILRLSVNDIPQPRLVTPSLDKALQPTLESGLRVIGFIWVYREARHHTSFN